MTGDLRAIPGASGYLISADGRVFSTRRGPPRELATFDRRRPSGAPSGYRSVQLGRGRVAYVHRLVLLAFVGEPPTDDAQACHGNGDAADNRLENLRWGTVADNTADRHDHDAFARGWETRREGHAFSDLLESAAE